MVNPSQSSHGGQLQDRPVVRSRSRRHGRRKGQRSSGRSSVPTILSGCAIARSTSRRDRSSRRVFAATSTQDLVRLAGVTGGALCSRSGGFRQCRHRLVHGRDDHRQGRTGYHRAQGGRRPVARDHAIAAGERQRSIRPGYPDRFDIDCKPRRIGPNCSRYDGGGAASLLPALEGLSCIDRASMAF